MTNADLFVSPLNGVHLSVVCVTLCSLISFRAFPISWCALNRGVSVCVCVCVLNKLILIGAATMAVDRLAERN